MLQIGVDPCPYKSFAIKREDGTITKVVYVCIYKSPFEKGFWRIRITFLMYKSFKNREFLEVILTKHFTKYYVFFFRVIWLRGTKSSIPICKTNYQIFFYLKRHLFWIRMSSLFSYKNNSFFKKKKKHVNNRHVEGDLY